MTINLQDWNTKVQSILAQAHSYRELARPELERMTPDQIEEQAQESTFNLYLRIEEARTKLGLKNNEKE